jgi:hypothetical protein
MSFLKIHKRYHLAPIAVEILFIFPLKIKRLQRKAGPAFLKPLHFALLKLKKMIFYPKKDVTGRMGNSSGKAT